MIPDRAATTPCPKCAAPIVARLNSCPSCNALIHADKLKALAQAAEAASAAKDWTAALGAWRDALMLLPAGSRQYESVSRRITELSEQLGSSSERDANGADTGETGSVWGKSAVGLAAIALALWKFKFVLGFLATKGKLLLAGLTKGSTFFSMALSLGVYWAAWGWKFALGLVLSIYVHEMGHVAMLRYYGIKSSAPMFIPGFGAMVRMHQYPHTPREDARVGLAGPMWGLAAALLAWAVHLATDWESWAAIARVGAWINLFNLVPVWQLDGSRGFSALTRQHRWIAVAAIAFAWYITAEGILVLLLIAALFKAFSGNVPDKADESILMQYVALVLILAWMTTIQVFPISS